MADILLIWLKTLNNQSLRHLFYSLFWVKYVRPKPQLLIKNESNIAKLCLISSICKKNYCYIAFERVNIIITIWVIIV